MIIDGDQIKDLITNLATCAMPIFAEDRDGHPSDTFRGTGFMVKDQDRYFLVSAKHVLKEGRKDQRLFMPMTRRTLDLSRLVCASWDVDVAVCDLGKRWPLPQSLNKGALPFHLLSPSALPQDERLWGPVDQKWMYLISGFPAATDQINLDTKPMTSTAYLYGGFDLGAQIYSTLRQLDPDIHLAFNHDDRTELSQIPPPNGMSGSPVWLAYEVGEDLSNQKPFSVIGVFIQYWDEYQAAIAVHIKEVVKLMLLSRAIWH
jgi:hypothetical protein